MFKWLKKKAAPRIEQFDMVAPIKGKVVSLEEVPDPAFSTKAMGKASLFIRLKVKSLLLLRVKSFT